MMSVLMSQSHIERLKVLNDFSCDKELSYINCKDCPFFYREDEYKISRCLKRDIRDWVLYHQENDIDIVPKTFKGSRAKWESLTTEEKSSYLFVDIK